MTTKEFKEIENESTVFVDKAKQLLDKFTELNLTPTFNKSDIEAEYKTHLFGELMKIDKGLRFKFELHRTPEAKQKLINESINLDGYDVVDELVSMIEDYAALRPYSFGNYGVTAEKFLVNHSGNLQAAFGSYVRDITGEDLYLKCKDLESAINGLIPNIKTLSIYNTTMLDVIKKLFTRKSHDSHELEVSESYIIYLLDYEKDRLAEIERKRKESEEIAAYEKAQAEEIERKKVEWLTKQTGQ